MRSPGRSEGVEAVLALGVLFTAGILGVWLASSANRLPATATFPTPSPGVASTPFLSPQPLGDIGCRPASPQGNFPAERHATAKGGTAWAWFMTDWPPLAGVEDKTVWRLAPDHPIASSPVFTLTGPQGAQGHLNWGPALHGNSNWDRPGDEFGTGLVFTAPGCWDVHVVYGSLQSDIYLLVAPGA